MLNYTKSEESHAEAFIKKIADAGANLIVVGGSISELILHFVEKYKMMIVKLTSKHELRRLTKALNGVAVTKLEPPTEEEFGYCD